MLLFRHGLRSPCTTSSQCILYIAAYCYDVLCISRECEGCTKDSATCKHHLRRKREENKTCGLLSTTLWIRPPKFHRNSGGGHVIWLFCFNLGCPRQKTSKNIQNLFACHLKPAAAVDNDIHSYYNILLLLNASPATTEERGPGDNESVYFLM